MVKVIRFTAAWCNPCKMLAKELVELGLDGHIDVLDVDMPGTRVKVAHYGIRSVPTIIIDTGSGDFTRINGYPLSKENRELLIKTLS